MFLFLLFVAAITLSTVFSKNCSPNGQLIPLKSNPAGYIECINYKWVNKQCLDEHKFNNNTLKCESIHGPPSPPPPYTTTTTTRAPPTIDSERCTESAGTSGFKPHPYDCTKYQQCVHGYWMPRPCGPGTAWDQYNLVCNHYDLVCKTGNSQQKPN